MAVRRIATILALLAVACLGEEIQPGQLREALRSGPEGRAKAVRQLRERLPSLLRSDERKEALVGLEPVLRELASIPAEEQRPAVLETVFDILVEVGADSPYALDFARNMMSRPAPGGSDAWSYGLRAATRLKLKDGELQMLVFTRLPDMSYVGLGDALNYLRGVCGADPETGTKLAALLDTPQIVGRERRELLKGLRGFTFSPETARKLVARAVQALVSAKETREASDLIGALARTRGKYTGLIAEEQQRRLLKIAKEDQQQGRPAALLLILAGDLGRGGGLTELTDSLVAAGARNSGLLLVLGFAPVPEGSDGYRAKLWQLITPEPRKLPHGGQMLAIKAPLTKGAMAGIVSQLVRGSTSQEEDIHRIARACSVSFPLTEWRYWRTYQGITCVSPKEPAQWRARWEKIGEAAASNPPAKSSIGSPRALSAMRRKNLLTSTLRYPDARETPWLLGQALKSGIDAKFLLDLLWQLRHTRVDFEAIPGLTNWLAEVGKSVGDPFVQLKAVSLFATIPGMKDRALPGVEAFYRKRSEARLLWTPGIELLIELAPDSPTLAQFREAQASKLTDDHSVPGAGFVVWLLDTRQGRSAGMPPMDSLPSAMERPDWEQICLSLARSRNLEQSHAAALRSPHALFASLEEGPVLSLLGALDALELAMARKEKRDGN